MYGYTGSPSSRLFLGNRIFWMLSSIIIYLQNACHLAIPTAVLKPAEVVLPGQPSEPGEYRLARPPPIRVDWNGLLHGFPALPFRSSRNRRAEASACHTCSIRRERSWRAPPIGVDRYPLHRPLSLLCMESDAPPGKGCKTCIFEIGCLYSVCNTARRGVNRPQ